MSEDFYDVLGVSRDASEDEIRTVSQEKAREDRSGRERRPRRPREVPQAKKAKEVLTDEEKRQTYDQMGHERFEQAEKRGGAVVAAAAVGWVETRSVAALAASICRISSTSSSGAAAAADAVAADGGRARTSGRD